MLDYSTTAATVASSSSYNYSMAAGSDSASGADSDSDSLALPEMDWCFDMELYYRSLGDEGREMIEKIGIYKTFSFRVNGLLTLTLIAFGFMGNCLLLGQIRVSRHFSRRLAVHLGMLCCWDALLLASCLLTYGVPSLIYRITPYYGPLAFILFIFQPIACTCVSGTIWQVLFITLERYLAVTRPLEQRTLRAQFGIRTVCAAIVLFVSLLNILPVGYSFLILNRNVPFDRALVPCFEVTRTGEMRNWTLLKPYDDDNTKQKISMILRFIPDLLFRAPVPIIIIAFLTVKTIQLLSFKFIICNSLYMFNSILIEILGIGRSDMSTGEGGGGEGAVDAYMNSFYLLDASNMLLVVHSASNWIIFFHWPRIARSPRKKASFSASASSGGGAAIAGALPAPTAALVLKKFTPDKERISAEIVAQLCCELPPVATAVTGRCGGFSPVSASPEDEQAIEHAAHQLARFIEQALKWFAGNGSYSSLRAACRRAGEARLVAGGSGPHLSAEQWKTVRAAVVGALHASTLKSSSPGGTDEDDADSAVIDAPEALADSLTRAFNIVLHEARSGLLCAAVEATQQNSARARSSRTSHVTRREEEGGESGRSVVTRLLSSN